MACFKRNFFYNLMEKSKFPSAISNSSLAFLSFCSAWVTIWTWNMALVLLLPELILYLSNFLCDSSLNGLIRTRKSFAHFLTPILYEQIFTSGKMKHRRPKHDWPDLDPYNLLIIWHHCVRHWKSNIVLDYIRLRLEHILKNNVGGTKQTLLHVVAQSKNVILVDILVHEKGMDINSEWQYGGTPLFEAIRSDKEAMFK